MPSIDKLMTTRLHTLSMDNKLADAKQIFDQHKFHHILVVDKDKLFGVLSDRDLLKALSPNVGTSLETTKEAAMLNKRVHLIMSRKPVTLPPEADLLEAIEIFNRNRLSCIPVVDENQKPVGILSWRDIMKALEKSMSKSADKKG